MQKVETLIYTKLHLPFTRQALVARPRLQQRLTEGFCGPLTLITAPAGFGKTTLVAAYIATHGLPVAWLSLDKEDNQVERFLNYLIAALQETGLAMGSQSGQMARAARPAPPKAVLTTLINELEAAGQEIALVLDDYQFVSSREVHEAVTFLLEYCPRPLHVVIATRSDPPLPLARLRARGQTVELRAADLCFTELEAAQFLNDVMGLDLDEGAVAKLTERTEGWIVGLQMAALSMRDRKDAREFITNFSGTNRYILDYLMEEVLASQPPEIQHFLLYTSILDRLLAPLCDAILASEDGVKQGSEERLTGLEPRFPGGSASSLEYLEKANLFLVPLDDARTWYRYHHLFADLLRTQLQKALGSNGVAQLHVRAAEWLGQNDSILEAIEHASLAQDDERVERLIEQSYMEIVRRGEQSLMRFWAGKLTKELVYRRPWLCIYEAHSRAWFGELDEADRLLEAAEKLIPPDDLTPDTLTMKGHHAYVKSRVTAMRGDIQMAIKYCLAAREMIPASNLSLQFNTLVTLGYEYFLVGDFSNAERIFSEAVRTGISTGALIYTVAAACFVARMHAIQGRLRQSYETYQMADKLIREAGGEHRDARALVDVGLAEIFCEWNDLEAARDRLERGLDFLPLWGKADDLALTYVTLARIHLAKNATGQALEAVDNARSVIQTNGVFVEASQAVEAAQVRVWLAQGEMETAARWAASHEERLGTGEQLRYENEVAHIARARALIAMKQPENALHLLSQMEENARAGGRMGRVIEILLLEALAQQGGGDARSGLGRLAECLALAEPEGYVRIFLDEGQPVRLLLALWLAHAEAGCVRDYATQLLSQFEAESQTVPAAPEKAAQAGNLIEPLSQRELEVLHLLALGKTNQEIAGQLVVAQGTVKAHAASIYRKLDAANRTEAVAHARQVGLIP